MHARFYSSATGRFLSVDRIAGIPAHPQSWNRYTYVLSNPLKLVDHDGNYFSWAPGLATADQEFIRTALVDFVRRPGGRAAFFQLAMDPRRIVLTAGKLKVIDSLLMLALPFEHALQ
jgi:hypothetical protein